MESRYVVGIDLGTTNSVIAFADLANESAPVIEHLAVPQLTAEETVESLPTLPSFLYLATEQERSALTGPWRGGADDSLTEMGHVVGEYARRRSAEVPERTVAGAKSWLAHHGVDRRGEILPWDASESVPKISPWTAAVRYLQHLRHAWDASFSDAPLTEQQVVLTVPASFDAAARELTREAALAAGLHPERLVLLEEPQAAVYAWLAEQGRRWREICQLGDRLLVIDVGGGTTDLTLIQVAQSEGELTLERLAVGRHLLVGGDNMDLALAHYAAEQLAQKGVPLDPWQSVSLWHACRAAKERLLSSAGPQQVPVSVLGRGSRLIGGTVSVELDRHHVMTLLGEGFFPACTLEDRPQQQLQSGFVQLGLPFETDTAITRHVAAFLGDQAGGERLREGTTHVLFNGGVFQAHALQERMMRVLSDWFPAGQARQLPVTSDRADAVARGAAYYGWSKMHGGVRIRGGTARSYYVGIETAGLAVPGAPRPLKALCVVPFGMEEGTQLDVPSQPVGLVLGRPVRFRFFSSLTRKGDQVGQLLDRWAEEELQETDALEAELPLPDGQEAGFVPVAFSSRVTELGVLELWCVSIDGQHRWKLEFNVRAESA